MKLLDDLHITKAIGPTRKYLVQVSIKMKAEALQRADTDSRPTKASLTMYPPNITGYDCPGCFQQRVKVDTTVVDMKLDDIESKYLLIAIDNLIADWTCSKTYLTDYYERVGIFHQKTVSRTPQQNDVVKRQNRTLVEAARTMLIFSKAPMFLWAEAVATACYSKNRSLIHTRHHTPQCKTSYEHGADKKPESYFLGHSTGTPSSNTIDQVAPSQVSHRYLRHYYSKPCIKALQLDGILLEKTRTGCIVCLYNFVMSKFEPMNFKSAITEDCWFQAMQDEIYEFDRLQVWELVHPPNCVMIIALKWIYKVKLDEYGDVLKNKAQLVAKGYR
ncbi:retrovirus-related pol polyprotein from transposon TNT 1-94 [Tanacetum coccineum]